VIVEERKVVAVAVGSTYDGIVCSMDREISWRIRHDGVAASERQGGRYVLDAEGRDMLRYAASG
jgi:hypothetical protein